ncbi:MAG: hypothetical protein WCI27_11770, partial [Candidatus Omnitrophota bacterium]
NGFLAARDESGDPLKAFCYSFVQSMVDSLLFRKLIVTCPHCGEFMIVREGKKYCSRDVEGKDCGKKARNKAYYQNHREECQVRMRKDMKDLREFRKSLKLKKEWGLLKQPLQPKIQSTEKKEKMKN